MSGDAERLVVGFSYSMMAGVMSSVFLYIAGLIVMRLLGPSEYGLYQLVLVLPGIMTPLLNFGIEVTLVRFVSRHRVGDRSKALKIARFLFMLRISVCLLASVTIIALAPWITRAMGESVEIGVIVAGLYLLGNMMYIFSQSVFQAFFLMRERTMIMVAHGGVYLVVVPVMIHYGFGYLSPFLAFTLTSFTAFLLALILAWRRDVALTPSSSREGIDLAGQFKFAAPIYANLLAVSLFAQMGVILIRLVGLGVVDLGYFKAVYNVVGVGSFIAIALNVVVLPYVSELESKGDSTTLQSFSSLVIRLLALIVVPGAVGIYLISGSFLELLLPDYLEALELMKVLSLMLLFYPIMLVSNAMLTGAGRPRLVLQGSLVALVGVVSLGVPLGVLVGARGIAVSYVLAAFMGTAYSILKLRSVAGLRIQPSSMFKVGLASGAMALVVSLIVDTIPSVLIRIVLAVLVGMGAYFGLILGLRALSVEDIAALRKTVDIARSKAVGPMERED